ncbi:MAG: D-alanyl-D-alanine carboxypeptidase family protein [Faecalibacterium prausnitzii]
MQAAAAKDGVDVRMQSGYRSVSYQKKLYDNKTQYYRNKGLERSRRPGKGGCHRQPAGLLGAQLRPCRRPEQPGAHHP